MHHDLPRRVFVFGILFALAGLVIGPTSAVAENIAIGAVTWANSSLDSHGPLSALDGRLDTYWDAGDVATQVDANWLMVDLGSPHAVDNIVLTSVFSQGAWEGYDVTYLLYTDIDGTDWGEPLGQGTLIDTADMTQRSDTIDAGGKMMRYVWFIAIGGTHQTQLAECAVNAVPEPSSLALLGVGAFGLFGYAWRKRKAS
jgi:hypothetical protein